MPEIQDLATMQTGYACLLKAKDILKLLCINLCQIFSSPEPWAQGELLPLANVRRASSVVRRASSTIALNNISSETARPRALIFGM